jgi:hypothetical protein
MMPGFNVTAFDLSSEEWRSRDVVCRECDFNGSLEQIGQHGPFAALCAIEVMEQQKDVVMIHIGDGHSKEVLDMLYEEVHEPIAQSIGVRHPVPSFRLRPAQ